MNALALEMPASTSLPLRPYQSQAIDAVNAAHARGITRPLVVLPTGGGKCHRAGQQLLMFDGSTRAVEDLRAGDQLMGPDSMPRTILGTGSGTGPMMTIQPVKGDPWTVNDEHVLTLVETAEKPNGRFLSQRGGVIRDVALPEWRQWSASRKHRHKLFRVPVDFPARETPPLDPYFLGVVLGDGTLAIPYRLSVTTIDPEIIQILEETAAGYGLHVRHEGIQRYIVGRKARNANPLVKIIRDLGLCPIACEDRFIPDVFKLGSRKTRLQMLAGLIDSDGSLGHGYDFAAKSERMARDVAFVARSVGLAAYVAKRPSGHYRVSISGDISIVPCRIARKIAPPRAQKKDALRTGFQVIPTGTVETYYGFTLDGDGRYLLDDFTVTHNTVVFSHLVTQRPGRSLILAHRDELISQAAAKLTAVSGSLDVGIVKAQNNDYDARVVVASVQTLARPGRLERLGEFSTVIVDEAHHAVADMYLDILRRLGCMGDRGPLTCGFTATAGRSDKVALGAVWQEIAYQRGIIQMIAEGYLCDVRAVQIGGDFNLGNAQVRAGDYTDASLAAELERSDALEAAADAYVQYAKDRLGVAFTPTIATAHALAAILTRKGVPAEAVDGQMPVEQRRAILARLHRGETRVVPNAQVLTEGWDEPAVSCALMLRPTKSAPLFVQMAGRVLRPFIGKLGGQPYAKNDALILDVAGSAEQLGLATIADLAGMPPGSVANGKSLLDAAEELEGREQRKIAVAAARTRQIELLRRSELRWLEVDGAWVLPAGADQVMILTSAPGAGDDDEWDVWRCEKSTSPRLESGKPLALDWARGVGEEIARAHGGVLSQAKAAWRDRPPSDAQRTALERMGYTDRLAGITRGAASDLMTAHYAAKSIRKLRKAAR